MRLLFATLIAAMPAAAIAATLSPDGYGPLKIGMTRKQVIAVYGRKADPDAFSGFDPEECDQFRPRRAPRGLVVMIEHDRLTRISLDTNTMIKTADGLSINARRATVLSRLGRAARVSEHKYSEAPAAYIDHWRGKPGKSRGIRYEMGTNNRVETIHAGGPSIEYVEGCA